MNELFSLRPGDEIRVIAPSQSWSKKRNSRGYERAKKRLESAGFVVTFGKNIKKVLHEGTANREQRVADIHDAYADQNVKLVMALTGGWSANEVLPLIDWELIKANPKPLIGFSDITVLLNAFYAKTGVVGFLGPNFSTLGRMPEWQYTLHNFLTVMNEDSQPVRRSERWSEHGRERFATKSWKTLQPGDATATLLGGNLGTFYLLQGTDYIPSFDEPFIFALEDDDEAGIYTAKEVSRRFESLLQLPGFRENLRGLIVGRFQNGSRFSDRELESILLSKELSAIPIATRVDFGHTLPMLTLPIGRPVTLKATGHVELSLSSKH